MTPATLPDLCAAVEEIIAQCENMRDQLYMSARILRVAKQRLIEQDCQRRELESRVAYLEQQRMRSAG